MYIAIIHRKLSFYLVPGLSEVCLVALQPMMDERRSVKSYRIKNRITAT